MQAVLADMETIVGAKQEVGVVQHTRLVELFDCRSASNTALFAYLGFPRAHPLPATRVDGRAGNRRSIQ